MKNGDTLAKPFQEIKRWTVNGVPSDFLNHSGMTKREEIAMRAMQGLCSAADSEGVYSHDADLVAEIAVEYADALLKKLENS